MARKLTFQGKAFIATGALLVLWWATPLFFKSILRLAFFEFQAPSFVAVSYLKDLQDFWAARNHSKN
ncbi:MAG: rod shape-determining protein MreC, partial [Opitutales bacterium]